MEWYLWVLIAAGVIAISYLKLKVWNNIKAKHKKKRHDIEE